MSDKGQRWRPVSTDDEEAVEEEDDVGKKEYTKEREEEEEEQFENAEKEVERDVRNCRGRLWKEREAKGNGEGYVLMENINVTSLDQNKEALIKSKANAIFFQEHKVRKDEKGNDRDDDERR